MIKVTAARATARSRLGSKLTQWAVQAPDAPVLRIALKPPLEREVRADERAAEAWVRE